MPRNTSGLRRGITPGGKRNGAGRKPDWFKEKCASILERKKLIDFVGRVASGEETEQKVVVVRDGNEAHTEVEEVRASIHDRLYAFEMLANWGVGKPAQTMALTNPDGTALVMQVPFRDQGQAGQVK